MGGRVRYDVEFITSAIRETQQALVFFKDRLDVHLFIASTAIEIQRMDIAGDQLVLVLKRSKENNNAWISTLNNPMSGDPKKKMINNVLNRLGKLFYAKSAEGDAALEKVSNALIQFYPDLVYGYAYLGSLNLAKKKYDIARKYYNQALSIAPNDEFILSNLKLLNQQEKKQ